MCEKDVEAFPGQTSPSFKSQDENKNGVDIEGQSARPLKRWAWIILCLSMLMVEIQAALDATITADLQPTIIKDLGEVQKFPWINVTYQMASSGTCLLWGNLYTVFDHKILLLFSRVLFAAGSVLSGAAPTMNSFIVGKVIGGLGGSGTYIGILAVLTSMTAAKDQARYFAYIGFSWGLGTILGPVIGGGFADSSAGWRWAIYFEAILAGVTFPVFLTLLPSSRPAASSANIWSRVTRLDLIGSVSCVGALASGVMALSFGGTTYPFSSGQSIGLFVCSAALWALFGLQQSFAVLTTKALRLIPVHILTSWKMWLLIVIMSCPITTLFTTIYYLPLYFQYLRGEAAITAAIHILPFLFTTVTAMLISGRLISTCRYTKLWFVAGSTLALIMAVCLYTMDLNTPHAHIYGYLVIGGVGTGLYTMNAGPIMSALVEAEDTNHASSIFGCVDLLSGAVATAVANCIFLNRAAVEIGKVLPNLPRANVLDALAGIGESLTADMTVEQEHQVLLAILEAIRDVWIQQIATASLSVVLAVVMGNWKVRKA